MRMQQLNIRRPMPLPVAGALATPAWWGPEEDADARAAAKGCHKQGLCHRCTSERCADSLRVCRTCATWSSARGRIGACEHGQPRRTLATGSCSDWRARL